jgi:hypothetical protein
LPHEWSILKQPAVLLEEAIAKPRLKRFSAKADLCQQAVNLSWGPLVGVGQGHQGAESLGCRSLTAYGGQANNAVAIDET